MFVRVAPELVEAACSDLGEIYSSVSAANVAAAASTTSVPPAGFDDVSIAVAQFFGSHAITYQEISEQASEFYNELLATLKASGAAYAITEWINSLPAPPYVYWEDLRIFLQGPAFQAWLATSIARWEQTWAALHG
ncbi:hypothetical protein B1987_28210 [Mycobacterium kansasii]|uniref:PE-PGRS family protein PE_PGRS16 n=1 Tax=Mycobacterium attenuatum TaxID=2341086 RepID=A0A498PZY8_9MYCO|nr:PE family protein [Mycobacterium attenuatum]ORB87012.1 hypothetical protein B1987_28210 [Mycobacterium kansasii]VBA38611.1 PE-PGRS family protein PE_PGRS16 [Mycobacterium attenuatum]VBA57785.1 PE-PGRS family protein PE_PGRS16 [Mycobacterium attenuatum]